MATLQFSAPPEIEDANYSDFEPWLQYNQFDRMCCYCVLSQKVLEVEHYVPRSFDSSRTDDPFNLLLACPRCNRAKWDYHPKHKGRRRLPRSTHGFMALDLRNDDYANFIRVQDDGVLIPLDGVEKKRAAWHMGLTLLDLPTRNNDRKDLLDLLVAAEAIVAKGGIDPEVNGVVLSAFAREMLFYDVWGIAISKPLREEAVCRREQLLVQRGL